METSFHQDKQKIKIAQEILNEYKVEEAREFNDLSVRGKRCTLGDLAQKYIEHCESSMSPRWVHNKGLLLKNQILPFFGESIAIRNLTSNRIEEYQRERLKTVKPRTVNIETHHVLLAMLRKGVDWKMLPIGHLPKVAKLQEEKGRLRFLTSFCCGK
jgi:hypothetical protein